MRAVLSRVARASITIDGEFGGSIEKGFLVLLGIGSEDKESDAVYLAKSIPVTAATMVKTTITTIIEIEKPLN